MGSAPPPPQEAAIESIGSTAANAATTAKSIERLGKAVNFQPGNVRAQICCAAYKAAITEVALRGAVASNPVPDATIATNADLIRTAVSPLPSASQQPSILLKHPAVLQMAATVAAAKSELLVVNALNVCTAQAQAALTQAQVGLDQELAQAQAQARQAQAVLKQAQARQARAQAGLEQARLEQAQAVQAVLAQAQADVAQAQAQAVLAQAQAGLDQAQSVLERAIQEQVQAKSEQVQAKLEQEQAQAAVHAAAQAVQAVQSASFPVSIECMLRNLPQTIAGAILPFAAASRAVIQSNQTAAESAVAALSELRLRALDDLALPEYPEIDLADFKKGNTIPHQMAIQIVHSAGRAGAAAIVATTPADILQLDVVGKVQDLTNRISFHVFE